MRVAAESAAWLGAVPLIYCATVRPSRLYWWIAASFAVSCVADNAARFLPVDIPSNYYPISQAGLVGAAFLPRKDGVAVLCILTAVALFSLGTEGPLGIDVALRCAAFGSVLIMALTIYELMPVRTALVVYYGLGLAAWFYYAAVPGWTSWGAFQLSRLAGIALFCGAAARERA